MKKISNEEYNIAHSNPDYRKILKSATKYYGKFLTAEEIECCKDISLWKCLSRHDENRSKFTTFLYNQVCWECSNAIKEKYNFKIGKNVIFFSEINSKHVYDKNDDKNNDLNINDILECLNQEDREIINMRFFDRMTFAEIGKKKGYTYQAAKNKIEKVMKKLKYYFSNCEN